jgi:hypothetical protein
VLYSTGCGFLLHVEELGRMFFYIELDMMGKFVSERDGIMRIMSRHLQLCNIVRIPI